MFAKRRIFQFPVKRLPALTQTQGVGPRQIRVVASTGNPDLVGDILEPMGCICPSNGVPLQVDHANSIDSVVGRAYATPGANAVTALCVFLPEGVSELVDQAYSIYKSGAADAVSVGFDSDDFERLPSGGRRYKTWRLLELSLVVVPCNLEARVTEKRYRNSSRPFPRASAPRMSDVEIDALIVRSQNRLVQLAADEGPAHWAAAARTQMEKDILHRHALAYDRDPQVQKRIRERELRELLRR